MTTEKTYTESEVRKAKYDILQTLGKYVNERYKKALARAYQPGHLDLEAEAQASAYSEVLAMICGLQNEKCW